MNFVEQYYEFKYKWYYKISNLLFDFYINRELNNQVEKIKYDYLDELIRAYLNKEKIDEEQINSKLASVNFKTLNKLEYELLKYVLYVSENYPSTRFEATDYVYFTMLLEITANLYNSAFIGVSEKHIYNTLKENLFRFEFVDFKRKQSKVNLLLKYLKYIHKNEKIYFSNLDNDNVEINLTSLSYHRNYYVIDIKNKLPNLLNYDMDLVESVLKNHDYLNKLFILNFNLLMEKVIYLLEKENFTIDKVIFNLDKYKYSRAVVNYINSYDSVINKHIMFCSKEKKKLDIISNRYSKCIYLSDAKFKTTDFKEISVLVKKSFWQKRKIDSQKYTGLKFITISDNIAYKFEREEM